MAEQGFEPGDPCPKDHVASHKACHRSGVKVRATGTFNNTFLVYNRVLLPYSPNPESRLSKTRVRFLLKLEMGVGVRYSESELSRGCTGYRGQKSPPGVASGSH